MHGSHLSFHAGREPETTQKLELCPCASLHFIKKVPMHVRFQKAYMVRGKLLSLCNTIYSGTVGNSILSTSLVSLGGSGGIIASVGDQQCSSNSSEDLTQ